MPFGARMDVAPGKCAGPAALAACLYPPRLSTFQIGRTCQQYIHADTHSVVHGQARLPADEPSGPRALMALGPSAEIRLIGASRPT